MVFVNFPRIWVTVLGSDRWLSDSGSDRTSQQ